MTLERDRVRSGRIGGSTSNRVCARQFVDPTRPIGWWASCPPPWNDPCRTCYSWRRERLRRLARRQARASPSIPPASMPYQPAVAPPREAAHPNPPPLPPVEVGIVG